MKQKKNKVLVITALLIFVGAISWQSFFRQYTQSDTVNIHLFPKEIAGWQGTEVPISDHDYDILETRNAFTRVYRSPQGAEIMLFVVYSQNNRKVSHPPEICYTGSGAAIVGKGLAKFDTQSGSIYFNRVAVEFGETKEAMYYAFKVGKGFTPNYWNQQIQIAFKALLGQPASSALIRLSMTANGKSEEELDAVAREFFRDIFPAVAPYLP